MQIGRGHCRVSAMVFNTFRLTPAGREHLQSPILVELPASTTTEPLQPGSPSVSTSKAKLTRKSKGTNLLPALRRLLTSHEHWFEITESSDYQYPGTFRFPHPQRLGFSPDITKLPLYSSADEHFLFTDIQIGKGKPREPRLVSFIVDGKDEQLYYRIAPCGGVKLCPVTDCSYTSSTREHRACPSHPTTKLSHSADCPVEFVYVWPANPADKRRWLTGLLRTGELAASNLHNHPLHGATKITMKVIHDIQQKLEEDPTLRTHDIITGTYL